MPNHSSSPLFPPIPPVWQASFAAVEKERERGRENRRKTLHTTYLTNVRIRESVSATAGCRPACVKHAECTRVESNDSRTSVWVHPRSKAEPLPSGYPSTRITRCVARNQNKTFHYQNICYRCLLQCIILLLGVKKGRSRNYWGENNYWREFTSIIGTRSCEFWDFR